MNAPDIGGREHDPEWRRELFRLLEYLAGCGVDKLTIAHPSLMKLVVREFPDFGLNVSLIAGVDSVSRAREYEKLGVEVINVDPFTINRDFEALRAIRDAVQCKLEVYANIACLDRCPSREAHYRHSARASREDGDPSLDQDSFLRVCSRTFLANPVEFLRSPFIRPEDVRVYRDLGIELVKLADRTEPAEVLLRTARAYCEERFEGNLFDLIFRRGKKFRAGVASTHPEARDLEVPIVIDNRALDRIGFIERIGELRGEELEEFYRSAAAEIVTYTDPRVIDQWRRILR
jgi:collagenase-like PrtC family protease